MSTTASSNGIDQAHDRNEEVWQAQTELLFAGRVHEAFAHWRADARYESAYPVEGLPPVVEGREAIEQMFATLLALGERIERRDFRLHRTADPEVVFIEEVFAMDLAGGGRFENRVVMRVTFRDGLVAEVLEYADRRAMEELLGRIGAAAG